MARFALTADHLTDAFELLGHALVVGDDLIESVGDLAGQTDAIAAKAHTEAAIAHLLERNQEFFEVYMRITAVDSRCPLAEIRRRAVLNRC